MKSFNRAVAIFSIFCLVLLIGGCGGGNGDGTSGSNNPPVQHTYYGEQFSKPEVRHEMPPVPEGEGAEVELCQVEFKTDEAANDSPSRKKVDTDSQVSTFIQGKVTGLVLDFFLPDGSGGLIYQGSWQLNIGQAQRKRIPAGEYYLRAETVPDEYQGYWAEMWKNFCPNEDYTLDIELSRKSITSFPLSFTPPTLEGLNEGKYTLSFNEGFSAESEPELKDGKFQFRLGCKIVNGDYPSQIRITVPGAGEWWSAFNILDILTVPDNGKLTLTMKDDKSDVGITANYPATAWNSIVSPEDGAEVGTNFVVTGKSVGMPGEVHLKISDQAGNVIEMVTTPVEEHGYQFSVNAWNRLAPGEIQVEVFGLSGDNILHKVCVSLTLVADSLEGKLVKPDGIMENIYYYVQDGHKHLIGGENSHTQAVMASWSFNPPDAVTIDKALLEQIPAGEPVRVRAGRNILQPPDGKYYLIGREGVVHQTTQEKVAELYGAGNYEGIVLPLSQELFNATYKIGDALADMVALPDGTIAKGGESVYMILGGSKCLSNEIPQGILPILLSSEELARYADGQEVTDSWECLSDPLQEITCGVPVELNSKPLSADAAALYEAEVPSWMTVRAKLISLKCSCPLKDKVGELKVFYGAIQVGVTITNFSPSSSSSYNISCDLPIAGKENFSVNLVPKLGATLQGHFELNLSVSDSSGNCSSTGFVAGEEFSIP